MEASVLVRGVRRRAGGGGPVSPDCPWLMHGAWTTAIPTRADYAAELAKTQRLLAAERQDMRSYRSAYYADYKRHAAWYRENLSLRAQVDLIACCARDYMRTMEELRSGEVTLEQALEAYDRHFRGHVARAAAGKRIPVAQQMTLDIQEEAPDL